MVLNDEGISGGGNVEPVVKPILVDEVNWSSVGGFITLANGFWTRGAVEPNGFVVAKEDKWKWKKKLIDLFVVTFCICNKFIEIN